MTQKTNDILFPAINTAPQGAVLVPFAISTEKNRTYSSLLTSALLAGALSLAPLSYADSTSTQLKNLQKDIQKKELSVKQQQAQQKVLQKLLLQQQKIIDEASRKLRTMQGSLGSLNKEIDALSESITRLELEQNQQQKFLEQQVDAVFRQGKNHALKMLLDQEGGKRNDRIISYYRYLNLAREQAIAKLGQIRSDLSQQYQSRVKVRQKQESLLTQHKAEQDKLQLARNGRQQTLNQLETALKKDQQYLTRLRQNEKQLREKIARVEREAKARAAKAAKDAAKTRKEVAAKQQKAKKSGAVYNPTKREKDLMALAGGLGKPKGQAIWPVRGSVEHSFGEVLQGELRWKGMVINAKEGQEIKAIAEGRVVLADWLQGYGLMVVIEHGKGDMSLYGYGQSALVKVGDKVKAGHTIALVGVTEGQRTPALYFEIRRQGQAVNPLPWLGK